MEQANNDRSGDSMSEGILPDDIIIAVMGMTGAGKTSFISHCVGRDVGIGHGVRSETKDVTVHSLKRRGRTVWLIDTPGFNDTSRSDVSILNNIAFWLSHAYRAQPPRLLSGLIYIHPITATRMMGTGARNIQMMRAVCGDDGLPVMWLMSSMWDKVDRVDGMEFERQLTSEPSFWGNLTQHGAKTWRHYNTEDTALSLIDDIITRNQRILLTIQKQMVDEQLDVDATDAGRQLGRRLQDERRKAQRRLDDNTQKLEQQLAQQQSAAAKQLRKSQAKYLQELAEKDQNLDAMRRNMEQLRREKVVEFQAREKEFARKRREQDEKIARLAQEVEELRAARLSAQQQTSTQNPSSGQYQPNLQPQPNVHYQPNVQYQPHVQHTPSRPSMPYDSYNANLANNLAFAAQQQQQQQQQNATLAMINAELAVRTMEEQAALQMQQATALQEMAFQQTMAATTGNMFYPGSATGDMFYQGATQLATQAVASACVMM